MLRRRVPQCLAGPETEGRGLPTEVAGPTLRLARLQPGVPDGALRGAWSGSVRMAEELARSFDFQRDLRLLALKVSQSVTALVDFVFERLDRFVHARH